MTEISLLESIIDLLESAEVEFLVVGGQAEALFGSPRLTYDIDLCYRKTPENLERLATVLQQIKPTLRNAPPDLPFVIDARSLALGDNFTFSTEFGDLDLLGYLEPIGTYENLIERAERHPIGDHEVNVISLEDLIRIKQHVNRPKDRDSLKQLLAIEQLRRESND